MRKELVYCDICGKVMKRFLLPNMEIKYYRPILLTTWYKDICNDCTDAIIETIDRLRLGKTNEKKG